MSRRSVRTRKYRGGSIMSWIKTKALPWLRKTKLASKGLAWAGKTFNAPAISSLGAAAGHLGYGRRRVRRRGMGLRMAGGALRL
jgi:hypothetical protein